MHLRRGLVGLFVIVALVFTGCFGSFGATTSLHRWNKGASGNAFVQTIIFWALIIVPVYEVLLAGDFLIFNVIEFWTGKSVFADASLERRDDGTFVVHNGADAFVFTPRPGNVLDVTHNGALLGQATVDARGDLVFTDVAGQTQTLTAADLDQLRFAAPAEAVAVR